MKTKFFFFAGLLAACLTSCSEMDEFADNTGYVDDGKSIKIEVTDEFAFVTSEMNEREKDAKIEKLAGFRKAIRLLGRFDLDSPEQSAQA